MILDDLVAATEKRLAVEQAAVPLAAVQAQAAAFAGPQKPSFIAGLASHFGIIAEVKQASPSKGVIASDFPYQQIAADYTAAGVDAISVLTEPDFFHGDLRYLETIAAASPKPVLRKDFVIDPYMLYQAKAAGASLVLLIVAILSDQQLQDYYQLATDLGLEVLVECHDAQEVQRALAVQPRLIGVNNRNLKDFSVDITTSVRLREAIPAEIKVLAESGITAASQLAELKAAGINGVLIGETFMRAPDRQAIIRRYQAVVA
ncbi:MAG: indole-3-glycerol phosphate synthase TrpC [Lactobacillus sp.]|jgi:indole-3-glycerol phosphate synthase|nr:indole-3-glycerol phosphate synthase TrpC [Lactobacillus sp.]MCI2033772.1 indole-3-glycerol phosphate synthase TrpC [Lactobacillus sp.]